MALGGPDLNIWDTNWIPNITNLRSFITGPLTKNESNLRIRDICGKDIWDLEKISFDLLDTIINNINTLVPNKTLITPNNLLWSISFSGVFATSSCYKIIDEHEPSTNNFK